MRIVVNTETHLHRLDVETNRYMTTVGVNAIHECPVTSHSLGIVETTSPI